MTACLQGKCKQRANAPDRDGGAADVRAGAAAEGEEEVDDAHDHRQRAGSRRDQADDVQVLADLLYSAHAMIRGLH